MISAAIDQARQLIHWRLPTEAWVLTVAKSVGQTTSAENLS
jgi:hypothetical protein